MLFLTAAFVGGAAVASLWRSTGHTRVPAVRSALSPAVQTQAGELWDDLQNALAGLASVWLRTYIGDRVPGFAEQYQRAVDQRAGRGV